MTSQRIAGIALLVGGVALFLFGMNASESVADQVSEFFTGNFSDTTVWTIAGGVASAVAGVLLLLAGGRGALR